MSQDGLQVAGGGGARVKDMITMKTSTEKKRDGLHTERERERDELKCD